MNETNRQRKLAQIIQEDFAELLRRQASESKQRFLVTVSGVYVTADLSIARIYLSIFPTEYRTTVLGEIETNKSYYRYFIGKNIGKQIRRVPDLKFYLDTSLDAVERLEKELGGKGDNPIR
ncbi:MAG: 30S ribosome-binding factor RbfA [Bergeyella sp.]|nr:30S ribosome-binding factor RbfA [Bergeyella sp.]